MVFVGDHVGCINRNGTQERWPLLQQGDIKQDKVTEHLPNYLLLLVQVGDDSISLHEAEDGGPDHVEVHDIEDLVFEGTTGQTC